MRKPRRMFSQLGEEISLTSDQIAIQQTAKQFAIEHIVPFSLEWDLNSHFPKEELKRTAQLGFGGI